MDVIEYAEKIRGAKLLESEKELLRIYEKMPKTPRLIMSMYAVALQKLPHKCFFCEFDRGPYMESTPQCKACRNLNKFQVKNRMGLRQAYEWELYKQLKGE